MNSSQYQERLEKARISRQKAFERKVEKDRLKQRKTLQWALMQVKGAARRDTWSTDHANCFRFHSPPAESEAHIRAKFERFLEWRKHGAIVFTEMRWLDGSRSDLVICLNNGEVFIEEIAESEKEISLLAKEEKYPFPMKVIKCSEEKKKNQ